jgi:hypothetical protein
MGEKINAMFKSAKAQMKAMPGALGRDILQDWGNTYQAILTQNASFNVPLPPGSTDSELSELHQTVAVAAPEPEETETQPGLTDELGDYSGPGMDMDKD